MTDLIPPALKTPTPETVESRQRSRAIVMAWLLGGFVVLIFAISIVKIKLGMPGVPGR